MVILTNAENTSVQEPIQGPKGFYKAGPLLEDKNTVLYKINGVEKNVKGIGEPNRNSMKAKNGEHEDLEDAEGDDTVENHSNLLIKREKLPHKFPEQVFRYDLKTSSSTV